MLLRNDGKFADIFNALSMDFVILKKSEFEP